MLQSKSKKILIYFFLFLIIGTLNNKNLKNLNFPTLNNIIVSGLDEKDNLELINKLNFLKVDNLFFLNKSKINEIIDSNNFVEKFSIYKIYPSSIEIEIEKTRLLIKTDNNYYLGSNGKFMKINDQINDIPTIFGNFDVSEFFLLKDIIEKSNFKFENIDKLYFYPLKDGILKLKMEFLLSSQRQINGDFSIVRRFFFKKKNKNFKSIDLRQNKQIIVNE